MKNIKFFFDKSADTYEQAGIIQKKVADYLLNMIPADFYSTVVEIGSGRGFVTKQLIEKIFFNKYINIDISIKLLKKLKGTLQSKCAYINAQAERIPLRFNSVDLIVGSSCLHWIENPANSFLEILKLLKDNGKFYFSIFLSNTLIELQNVSKISGFGSFYPLKPALFYIELLDSTSNLKYRYTTKKFLEYFPSVKDLLISHKLTGTNYTKNKKFCGKEAFKRFCEIYENLYSTNKGIYATYEVLFIEGQKISPFP
jgi:malonyl-CoA O-methyltransferase